ncbi:probable pectinesterase 15 [Humulus lupulus]|uniref:probable pectinesterase 15 n=1 Tax=Humulus lupulus TaxID=3486 RepID=UPI002B40402A|nr:probable pectinesterase 15 [Humulus lupulus]
MEIQEKLMRFKFHILITLVLCFVITTLILVAPKFLTILAYFWPLLLSTALFLIAVLVFAKTSLPPAAADKTGEGLLDYVAGQPDLHHHHHHHNHNNHHDEVEQPIKPLDEHAVESSSKAE